MLVNKDSVTLSLVADSTPYHMAGVANLLEARTATLVAGANGFGLMLKSDDHTRGVRVQEVIPGGPAEAIGMRVGDVIVDVNGEPALDSSHETVLEMFKKITVSGNVTFQHAAAVEGAARIVELTKQNNGFGIEVVTGTSKFGSNFPRVGGLVDGGVAAGSGKLMLGDRLVSANGISLLNTDHDAVVELLGKCDTVTFEIESDESPMGMGAQTEKTRQVEIKRSSSNPALGLAISSDMAEINGFVITRVESGSPAATAGCAIGDLITAIDGVEVFDKSHDEMIKLLANSKPTVQLTLTKVSQIRNVLLNIEEGSKVGLIIVPRDNMTGLGGRIREVIPGTAAHKAMTVSHLGRGDAIVGINGEDVLNATHERIVQLLSASRELRLTLELSSEPLLRIGGIDLLYAVAREAVISKGDTAKFGLNFLTDVEIFGHVVHDLSPDGAVAKSNCGVKPGDIILKVNGEDVADVNHDDLAQKFGEAGSSINLELGDIKDVPGARTVSVPRKDGKLGILVAAKDTEEGSGVVITGVDPDGDAEHAGLRAGLRIIAANGHVLVKADHDRALSALSAGDPGFATITILGKKLN